MKLLINGKLKTIPVHKYSIDWNKESCSKGSSIVKEYLKLNFKHDLWLEEMRLPGSLLRVDFLNITRKFAIEYNDTKEGHHNKFNKFFHKHRSGFLHSIKRDMKKLEILEKNGYVVVEVYKHDLPLTREFFSKFEIYF